MVKSVLPLPMLYNYLKNRKILDLCIVQCRNMNTPRTVPVQAERELCSVVQSLIRIFNNIDIILKSILKNIIIKF